MPTCIRWIAATAIIAATLSTTPAQARQVEADTPKGRQVVTQKLAQAQVPYFFLVLGVGY